MEMPALYTPAQVADHLRVSRGTIYSLISRHEIGSVKVGRSRRFTGKHIHDYLTKVGPRVIVVEEQFDLRNPHS